MFKVGDRVIAGEFPHMTAKVTGVLESGAYVFYEQPDMWPTYFFYNEELKKVETTTMDNPLIKTVTTKSIIQATDLNPKELGWADISIYPDNNDNRTLELVIGAKTKDRSSCTFDKDSLGNLLKMLQEVHDLMKD
jgi:hypothetical protein